MAEGAGKRLSDYSLTNWTEDDGPFPFGVLAIAQDREGYLWLGARTGLIRFDGASFEVWHGSEMLPTERLSAILTAHDDSMWLGFGTTGAVARIRDGRATTFGVAEGLAGGPVSSVYEDTDGSIWISSSNGLTRYHSEKWERVGAEAGLPLESVLAVLRDRGGRLWVGTSVGVYRHDRDSHLFQRISDVVVRSLVEDHDGRIWASDSVSGFRLLDGEAPRVTLGRQPVPTGAGRRVMVDRRGALWVATRGAGAIRISDGRAERLARSDGLISEDVRQVFEDRDGSIWIATRRGLSRLTERSVRDVTGEVAKDAFVYAVTGTRDGSVWTGTADGLTRLRDGRERLFGTKDGLPANIVTALHEDRSGTLWAATTRGVARFVDERFEPLATGDQNLQSVGSMTSDHRGRLWLCDTSKGVFVWQDGVLRRLGKELREHRAYQVYADKTDRIWVGFWDTGVAVLEDEEIRFYSPANGVPPGVVSVIHEDQAGHIWVGTDHGLARLEGNGFQSYHTRGLPETGYVSIIEDRAGFLWLATGVGLLRISPREFDLASTNSAHRVQYTAYGADDGLNGRAARPGMPSSAIGPDGSLWFVTSVGLARLDPERLGVRPPHGLVRIERMLADGLPLELSGAVALKPKTSRLEIDYSVLSLAGASKSRFRYRLDGFDKDWVDAGDRRQALYTNLPPGRFTFRVVSANDTGWNESGAKLAFALEPAFYQRRSFYVLTLLLAVAGTWAAWMLQVRHVRQQFSLVLAERARMGRELHDTLLQSLVGVALEFDDIAEQLGPEASSLRQQVSLVRNRVEHYIREARYSIWNLRSPTLETKNLPAALREASELVTMHHGVDYRFVVTGNPVRLDAEVEAQMLRIGQEAVSNAVRHGRPETVRMELVYNDDVTSLTVDDDGRGFDLAAFEAAVTEHWGIATMRERAHQVKARFTLQSRPGEGTTVKVVVSRLRRAPLTAGRSLGQAPESA